MQVISLLHVQAIAVCSVRGIPHRLRYLTPAKTTRKPSASAGVWGKSSAVALSTTCLQTEPPVWRQNRSCTHQQAQGRHLEQDAQLGLGGGGGLALVEGEVTLVNTPFSFTMIWNTSGTMPPV